MASFLASYLLTFLYSRISNEPGPHKRVHENLHRKQRKHPRAFWVLQIRLLTPPSLSIHKPVMVCNDPNSVLPSTYRLTSTFYLETLGESYQILYPSSYPSILPGHCSSCGFITITPFLIHLPPALPFLVPLRIQGHYQQRSFLVSSPSILNAFASSYFDYSLAPSP